MFSPVGNLPPSVYWRRRLIVIGSLVLLVVLVALTVRAAVAGGGDDGPVAAGSGGPSPSGTTTGPASSSESPSSSAPTSSTPASTPRSTSKSASRSTSAAPVRCGKGDLAVQAVVGKKSYDVGDRPVVELQVTNTGSRPCVQDLADRQVVLKVYNGESRVWGSHDCEIQPGTDDRTLPVDRAVRVSITWSGRTSQEGCKGTRQRVGAGTYTLYAQLSGKNGKAAQFTIG
ncbi:hypothetical protein SAMN05443575_3472 [Jatrophihabitans endophyticus]|uniref:Uncharacterized protein n=1 Tax=Jatrophihabitans endophyticus TaxID=1206085 RepID=A0A1M5R801_9ACTN|nr:hypothetical protein [Jatrophihabitans endophyticus]SHH22477.1 hypothetical protein SAMN05443575_3472 [Jatrophihabitans endophyticus]